MAELVALGDQVQEACVQSGQPVEGFLIVASDGTAEYQSPLPLEQLRAILRAAVEAL